MVYLSGIYCTLAPNGKKGPRSSELLWVFVGVRHINNFINRLEVLFRMNVLNEAFDLEKMLHEVNAFWASITFSFKRAECQR